MMRLRRVAPAAGVMLAGMTGHIPVHSPGVMRTPRPLAHCDSVTVPATLSATTHQITVVACEDRVSDDTIARDARLQRAVAIAAHALQLYARLTGVAYPAARYTLQFHTHRGLNGGLSTHDGAAFDLPLPDPQTERDRPSLTAKIIAHEVAHQWRWRGPHTDGWLAEGLSDFMAGQVWRDHGGPRAEEEFIDFYNAPWDDAYADDPALPDLVGFSIFPYGWLSLPWSGASIWNTPLDREQGYYRGAATLWMLEHVLGETHFWAALHTFLTAPDPHGSPSVAFQQAIQSVTGEDLGWFFREWVDGSGYPRVTVATAYDDAAQKVTLTIHQDPPVFRMPVTVRVGTSHGDILTHATMDGASTTVVVRHVMTSPTFVVFDDDDAIVKTLSFPQPTSWLAVQLHRDARPWQTWWTIAQLGDRATHDPAARAALVWAVLHARFALTRAQAAVAVGRGGSVVPSTVIAALDTAASDTAVIVRRAAVQGLSAIGTPAAQAVVRRLADQDASMLVRATAVFRAITMGTPDDRPALFLTAMQSPPTYLDILPLAATHAMALAGQCDSTTLAAVQPVLREPRVAATLQRVTDALVPAFARQASTVGSTCLQTFISLLPLTDPTTPVRGISTPPDDVAIVPFTLWHGVKHDWTGALIMFLADVDGHRGNYILDTGSGNFWLNRDSLSSDPRIAGMNGTGTVPMTVHTERIGTLTAPVDSIDIGPPLPQPSNAEVGIDSDSLGTNKQAALGNFGLIGMEPFEVIIDYTHQRLVWIRLDAAGHRLADVPAYAPAATVPLVPGSIHLVPMYAAQWWGIAAGRGGDVDTLLVDSGTQTETGLSAADQRLAADQLRQALVTHPSPAPLRANGIALAGAKGRDLNVLGYFFLRELGVVGFNLRTRQLILYH